MKQFLFAFSFSVLVALALACGSSSSSSSGGSDDGPSATLEGTIDEGVLNKAQYQAGTYSVSATASGTSTTGALSVSDDSDTVSYSIEGLAFATTYTIDVLKGNTDSVVSSTVDTTDAQEKARLAGEASDNIQINMFSTYVAQKYLAGLEDGVADPLGDALTDIFGAGVDNLEGITVSQGLPVRVNSTSGNTEPISVDAVASAKVKLISQVAKSFIYLDDASLAELDSDVESLFESVVDATSLENVTTFYKDDTFLEVIEDVKEDLPAGLSYKDMIEEFDPVLANLDFVESIDEAAIADLDALLDDTFASADNLTKHLLSYELAVEALVDDFPDFDYSVDTDEFFGDIYDDLSSVDVLGFTQEAFGELSTIFDEFEVPDGDDFVFEFDADDYQELFRDTFRELDEKLPEVSIDATGYDDLFEGIDFEGDFFAEFEDLTIGLDDIFDEDELDDVFADESGIVVFGFDLAHPTYGERLIERSGAYRFEVGTLAPVFVIDLLPTPELASLSLFELDDLFTLNIQDESGVAVDVDFTIFTLDDEPDRFYLGLHKSDSTTLSSGELQPGMTYGMTLVPSDSVEIIDSEGGISGNIMTKGVTFTTPFDGDNLTTQVDLYFYFEEFFREDVLEAQIESEMTDVNPSLIENSGVSGDEADAIRLELTSGVINNAGTYEILVSNTDALTWMVSGSEQSIGAGNYVRRQFFDVADYGESMSFSVAGSPFDMVDASTDATPTILVHAANPVFVDGSAMDLGLFDSGKLSLRAYFHGEEDDDSVPGDGGGSDPIPGDDDDDMDVQDPLLLLNPEPDFTEIGRYASADNPFDESAAEIVTFDPMSKRIFVVNANAARVDVLDASDPTMPVFSDNLDATDHWAEAGGINSVAVSGPFLAAAVENDDKQANGQVFLYDVETLSFIGNVWVGALPDMVTFTPDGKKILVANEGEPNDDYSIDPEGSVSIIDLDDLNDLAVTQVTFEDFNVGGSRAAELDPEVRVFGNYNPTALTVTGADVNALTVSDATGASANMWVTISGEGDPLPYLIESVNGTTIVFTEDLDDEETFTSTTVASDLTIYLHDGASSVAQDLEPEYIAVAPNGMTAWVALQENNAVAVIDIMAGEVEEILALGTKDHNLPGNELDVSDKDGDINEGVNIKNYPIRGMYMPDSIAAFEVLGVTYYITANEGDAREYDAYVEEMRYRDIPLDADAFDELDAEGTGMFDDKTSVGRLLTTITNDTDGDGDIDVAHSFGARSFTIWHEDGSLVFDSGSDMEVITAQILGPDFNNDNDENSGDSRSDAKGPEPEAVAVGQVGSALYAFVGLERVGGIMVYDVTNPYAPVFVKYLNNRDYDFDIEGEIDDGDQPAGAAGDLGPEGFHFVSSSESPTGEALLVVGSEVSGTTTIYEIALDMMGNTFVLDAPIHLSEVGRFESDDNPFDESAAEIVAYDAEGERIFVVNANDAVVDILDASDVTAPMLLESIDSVDFWSDAGGINSVAVNGDLMAIAVENDDKQANGKVMVFDLDDLSLIDSADVGALPDMLTFTPEGNVILVANEGEPNDDYSVDPVGSVSIVVIGSDDSLSVTTAGFEDFNVGGSRAAELPAGVRVFGNFNPTALTVTRLDANALTVSDASAASANMWVTVSGEGDPLPYLIDSISGNTIVFTDDLDDEETLTSSTLASDLTIYLHDGASSVAQDLEPEYIAVNESGTMAWVTLQENNAVAVVDIEAGEIYKVLALGTIDHSLPGNELDVSDNDSGVRIMNHPVHGMFMPDSIASFEHGGVDYYLTANEGDAREYDAYVEEMRYRDIARDEDVFSAIDPDDLFDDKESVGRLLTTITNDTDGDGDIDQAHSFGARSFTIWDEEGSMVFDSGSDFEVITARILGDDFNNDNDENSGDSRSDAKGPEPEAIAVGVVDGRRYAFIGLERVGGIMVYDISVPTAPMFVQYVNNRDYDYDIEGDIDDGDEPAYAAGDLGPEGFAFVSEDMSASGNALLIVGSEVSGTTTIYDIRSAMLGFTDVEASPMLEQIGRYASDDNEFDESAAEIVAFDPATERAFVVNAQAKLVDILDLSDPTSPTLFASIDATDFWSDAGGINSVDVNGDHLAIAIEHDDKQSNGNVLILNASSLAQVALVEVGALPDMVTFTPDGMKVLVANEGEPNDDYSIDPVGSVTIIDLTSPSSPTTETVSFEAFNAGGSRAAELPEGVRVFGNFDPTALTVTALGSDNLTVSDATGASANMWVTISGEGDPLPYLIDSIADNVITFTEDLDDEETVTGSTQASDLTIYLHDGASSLAQDLEPEYIAVSPDGMTAFVAMQENNAVAVIDVASASVVEILALGTKDHSLPGNELDVSDKDGDINDGVNIRTYPVRGMYMPDAIVAFERGGENFFITANEGDSREYDAYVEELRYRDAPRDSEAFGLLDPMTEGIFDDKESVGRLLTTITNDTDGDGDIDVAHSFGARSFTIWSEEGDLVFDSGSDFERITARILGSDFNNDNDENSGDSRSDAKGPEPEALAVGEVDGVLYAFIGLERVGGIMVYDITNPSRPHFVQYVVDRDYSYDIEGEIDDGDEPAYAAGDLGPEGFKFVSAEDSPTGEALLIVGSEVSGTTTIYEMSLEGFMPMTETP